ncbi:PDC sensor domain-containing protein [uncultured Helicobacter sp.]|uniref:PDC sensor domain-containing protein n=1 Tax=uncultured Helicobacter sp. TaxID=175537 RepID=UPI002612CF92|nr:PDC sensor domain-containing protein [uncultured Helicobacter sp.]
MLSKEILQFSEMRYEIRAYLCFLLQRNIKNNLPHIELNKIIDGLHKIEHEVGIFELLYVLDASGTLVLDGITRDSTLECKKGENHNERAYFYRAVKEKKCILTDPYPSLASGNLVVTVSYPLYNDKGKLVYVVCMDIPLEQTSLLVRPAPLFGFFSGFGKSVYFVMSSALFLVSALLLVKGGISMWEGLLRFNRLDIKDVFEATILITLSLAIFDLVRAIFEEEVLGRQKSQDSKMVHKTMTRFLGSIVIALAIEALMLVFKFTIIEPEKLIYAVYLIGAVTCLLIGLAVYMRFTAKFKRD